MGAYRKSGFSVEGKAKWKGQRVFIPLAAPGKSKLSHLMCGMPAHGSDAIVWLAVPYERKDEAKAMGARWNPAQKQWWMPKDVDPIPFIQAGFLSG
jgi:hypothetical protein